MEISAIRARVAALNIRNAAANKLVPLLQARLAEGFKVKGSGLELHKKDADAIKAIIEPFRHDLNSCYVRVTEYSLDLNIRVCLSHGRGCEYLEDTIRLANPTGELSEFELCHTHTVEEHREWIAERQRLRELERASYSAAQRIARLLELP